jgi:hypothetical protein
VPHQFFASSMLVTPVVSGLLGWEPDAPRRHAKLAPQLPADWHRVTLKGLRVGETRLDITIEQEPGRVSIRSSADGPPVTLEFAPVLPAGATIRTRTATETTWTGGLSVLPPAADRAPGDASASLRVIDVVWDGVEGWIDVEGTRGSGYELTLVGTLPAAVEGATLTRTGASRGTLRLALPGTPQSSARLRVRLDGRPGTGAR